MQMLDSGMNLELFFEKHNRNVKNEFSFLNKNLLYSLSPVEEEEAPRAGRS